MTKLESLGDVTHKKDVSFVNPKIKNISVESI